MRLQRIPVRTAAPESCATEHTCRKHQRSARRCFNSLHWQLRNTKRVDGVIRSLGWCVQRRWRCLLVGTSAALLAEKTHRQRSTFGSLAAVLRSRTAGNRRYGSLPLFQLSAYVGSSWRPSRSWKDTISEISFLDCNGARRAATTTAGIQ
jgi:hypothetical protein